MGIIIFLIAFPLISAFILLVTKGDKARDNFVKFAAVVMAAASIALAVWYFICGGGFYTVPGGNIADYCVVAGAVILLIFIAYTGLKNRKLVITVLAGVQAAALLIFEFVSGHSITAEHNIYIDGATVIMIFLTGIVGSIICLYTPGYFNASEGDSLKKKDKMRWYFLMFASLGAANGIVASNDVNWILFFMEVMMTAICFMMGVRKSPEAQNSKLRALTMFMIAGLGFVTGIIILGGVFGTAELNVMIIIGSLYSDLIAVPAVFLAFAGLVMAAQLPFTVWMSGADDVPAPAAALAQTVTLVNSGIFIIIKCAPVLGNGNFAGLTVMIVGGITFLMASAAGFKVREGHKVVAYSTAAAAGLAVACAAIGTADAVWAAVMIMIFHALAKTLMFVSEGNRSLMAFAAAGITMPLLGVFISRSSSVASVIDAENIVLLITIAFGVAAMAMYWIQWVGKIVLAAAENDEAGEKASTLQKLLAVLIVLFCILMPVVSQFVLSPYLAGAFSGISANAGLIENIIVAVVMTAAMLFVAYALSKGAALKPAHYRDDLKNTGLVSFTEDTEKLALPDESRVYMIGGVLASIMIVIGVGFMIGTLVGLLGGIV